jgi:hypothetical protein
MVKKVLLILFTVWLALLLFMPKQELFYKLEEVLARDEVKINERQIEEGPFSLTVKEADIYVKGVKVAKVAKLTFFTLLFYSEIRLEGLIPEASLKAVSPGDTESAVVRHSLLAPMEAKVHATGSFGELDGTVALGERKLRLDFLETKKIDAIKSLLKKDEQGWYYETSF